MLKRTLIKISLSLLMALVFTSIAYNQNAALTNANTTYENGDYYKASSMLVKAYNSISPKNQKALNQKSELAYRAAYSYDRSFDYEKATEWYQRAIDLKYYSKKPIIYFRLGNIYKFNGEYDKARQNYEEYLKLSPNDKQVLNALASLDHAVVMKDNRTRYTVKNERKINDNGMDMAPTVSSRGGESIVYGSSRPAPMTSGKDPINGEGYFNIWEATLDKNGNWQPPKLFESDNINTESSEGTMAFDGRYRTAFFTRCPTVNKKTMGCEIWMASKKGRGFGSPERVKLEPNDSISVGHPLPNEDGTALIFASDLPGGFGGKDLWYSEYDKRSKTWSTPINLGPEINTPGDELFPTYSLNGDLFFASNGHKGLGGLDIFMAKKTDDPKKFTEVENMGTPINSDADDYHMMEVDKKRGFFTSNRTGSLGSNKMPDIWSYEMPPNLFDLKVIVSEVGGNDEPIPGVTVQVTPSNGAAFTGVTNADGTVFWDKQPNGDRYINEKTDYTVTLQPKEGFHENTNKEVFTTEGLDYDQNFILEMGLLPQTPIVLPEVRYDLASDVLQVIKDSINSKDSLNYVYDLLKEYPGMVLKLISHTDSRGSSKSNEDLAQRRAQSCINYLVKERGVDPNRLIPLGKGENEPRIVFLKDGEYFPKKPKGVSEPIKLTEEYINQFASDKTLFEQLHQFNRRTEAEVVRMDYNAKANH